VLCQGTVLDLDEDLLPVPVVVDVADPALPESRPPSESAGLGSLEEVERAHILAVLHQTGWLIEGSKRRGGDPGPAPNTLRSRMNKLGLKRPSHDIS
jgi:hypothetical protein